MSFVFAEGCETRLSLAVYIVDGYKGAGGIYARVSLGDCEAKPLRNPSGYYIFSGLSPRIYTVRIDAGDNYLICEKPADLSAGGIIILRVDMIPSPSYPFSPSDTLVRGSVRAFGIGVPEAKITVAFMGVVSGTDNLGDFVVAFKGLKSLVSKTGNKGFVKIGGSDPSISAEHSKYGISLPEKVEVEEGKTAFVTISYP